MTRPPRTADIAELLNAAAAHYAAGRLDEAARLYRRAETANPADIRAAYSLAVIDIRRGRAEAARRRLAAVVARDPDLHPAWQNLGAVCETLELWDAAAEAYGRARALRPAMSAAGFGLARALAVLGRVDEAIDIYRALAAAPEERPRALTRLAVLAAEAIDDRDLADLRRAVAEPDRDAETRIGLWFALGEVLERRGADDEAFAAFAAGNRLKHEVLAAAPATRPSAVAQAHAASQAYVAGLFTPDFIARHHQGRGSSSAAPIFVVGMPRSGSSLIEQILAAHPNVQGLGETAILSGAADRMFHGEAAKPGDWRRMADAYLAGQRARGWRAQRLVDKTLENYLRIGLIHLMFPRAVILHSVRDPVETGLGCYRQLFASGNETLYDLRQIGEAYVGYRRVMAHWDAVLPGRVTDVRHEDLLADPEGRIRWLVTEACGLDWDPACLRFHEAQSVMRTASAAQVRRPISRAPTLRWRRYEAHLEPLLEALGPYAPTR